MIEIFNITIGGVIGSSITQWVLHRNAKIRQKDSLLREKMEIFVIALLDDYHFLNKRAFDLIEKNDSNAISPPFEIYKAEAIQELYFPELESNFYDVTQVRKNLDDFTYRIGDEKKREVGDVKKLNNEHRALAEYYLEKIREFRKEILKHVDDVIAQEEQFGKTIVNSIKHKILSKFNELRLVLG